MRTFLYNLKSIHHRMMMRYLRKRGWVVFYLEPKHRICNKGCCWLKLYEYEFLKHNFRGQYYDK